MIKTISALWLFSILFFAPTVTWAGWKIVQQKTSSSGKGAPQQITHYIEGAKMRMELNAQDSKSASILVFYDGQKGYQCFTDNGGGKCSKKSLAEAFNLLGGLTKTGLNLNFKEHKFKKTGKTKVVAGKTCDIYQESLVMEANMPGMAIHMKSNLINCYAPAVSMAEVLDAMAKDIKASTELDEKQKAVWLERAKLRDAGFILEGLSSAEIEMTGLAQKMPKETSTTKTLSIEQISIPASMFKIPPGYKVE